MKLAGRNYAILILVLITAVMHLAAALDKQLFPEGPDPLFLLNGLGYLGLLGAYFLPIPFFQKNHEWVRRGLMLYAIVTIAAWIFIWVIQYVIINHTPFFSRDSIYGVPSKIAELILIWLLSRDKATA